MTPKRAREPGLALGLGLQVVEQRLAPLPITLGQGVAAEYVGAPADGRYLLRTSGDTLWVEDLTLGYEQLLEVERETSDRLPASAGHRSYLTPAPISAVQMVSATHLCAR